MEKRTIKQPVEVRLFCDCCGVEMQYTGRTLLSNPPRYEYECPECHTTKIEYNQYPRIEYKDFGLTKVSKSELQNLKVQSNKVINSKENNKQSEISFSLNKTETEEYKKFVEKHKSCKFSATIGGKISVLFTPTGLGDIIVVKCNSCGKEKEITDVSNW